MPEMDLDRTPPAVHPDPFQRTGGQRLGPLAPEKTSPIASAMESSDAVLSIVAHELRSPLAAITLAAETLLNPCFDESARAETITLILETTSRMDRLIQNLLEVRDMQAGTLAIQPSPQQVQPLIEDLWQTLSGLAALRSIRLRFEIPTTIPGCLLDRDRIWQVFLNLLDNALRFSPEGAEVIVRAVRVQEGVRFSVSDAGPGIPQDQVETIFMPFWGSRSRGRRRGSGLGLAIARTIVEAHGGRIWVHTEEGLGSTFHFILPAIPEDVRRPAVNTEAETDVRSVRQAVGLDGNQCDTILPVLPSESRSSGRRATR